MPEALLLPFISGVLGGSPRTPTEGKRRESSGVGPAGASPPAASAGPRDPDGLRWYQREDLDSILRELDDPFIRATMCVEATGLGKTVIGSALAKHWVTSGRGRVLWAVTGEELCDQARDSLERMTGEYVSLERAGYRACGTSIVVGSVPTMKGPRLKEWDPETFSLIIFDEAHHAVASGPRAIFDHFVGANIVGFTATPERHDGKAQGIVFDSFVPVVEEGLTHRRGRQMYWGWQNGYLVRPIGHERIIESVDLSKIKTHAGDFAKGALDEEMVKSVAAIAKLTLAHCEDRKTLVFCPGVATAHGVCAELNKERPGCARVVDGTTPDDERSRIVKEFARDEFQYLVNCAVFGEGFDDPGIRAIVNAAPTKSKSRYQQRAGRGGRPLKGIAELPEIADRLSAIAASAKPDFLLLDLTGNAGQHSLVSFVSLDGRYTESEQKRAKKISEKDPQLTVPEVLRRARIEEVAEAQKRKAEEEAHREVLALAAKAAEVRSRGREFDPFASYGIKDPEEGSLDLSWQANPPTPKQIHWAKSCGIPTQGMSRQQMTKLFAANLMRTKRGLADFRTLDVLRRHDIKVGNITMTKARALLDTIARNRGYRPADAAIQAILGGR